MAPALGVGSWVEEFLALGCNKSAPWFPMWEFPKIGDPYIVP